MTAALTDRHGNFIGDGCFHVGFHVEQIEGVTSSVSKSSTTESVYVTYRCGDRSITCRFSNHQNNAVKFGDQLNGKLASRDEIMYHLGMKSRTFVPNTYLSIWTRQVAKKQLHTFEEADLTMDDLYAMGEGADISAFTGKLAKGSNLLILGSKVDLCVETRVNALGQSVQIGKYIYN